MTQTEGPVQTITIGFGFYFSDLCSQSVSSASAINSNWFPQHNIDLLSCDVVIQISEE